MYKSPGGSPRMHKLSTLVKASALLTASSTGSKKICCGATVRYSAVGTQRVVTRAPHDAIEAHSHE